MHSTFRSLSQLVRGIVVLGVIASTAGCDLFGEESDFEIGKYFYYSHGERIGLDRNRNQFIIRFDTTITIEDGLARLADLGIRTESPPLGRVFVVRAPEGTDAAKYYTSYGSSQRRTVGDSSFVRFATPVFRVRTTGSFAGLTDQFTVSFTDEVDQQSLQQLLIEYGLEIGYPELTWPRKALRVTKHSNLNALDMSNLFHGLDATTLSDPDFLVRLSK